jgi:hypothetical protein
VEIMAEMWDSEEVVGFGRRIRKEKRSRGDMEMERRREAQEMVWSSCMVLVLWRGDERRGRNEEEK